jgi:7-cyano-7-deazaguanine synthase in queuosine biosynthesis
MTDGHGRRLFGASSNILISSRAKRFSRMSDRMPLRPISLGSPSIVAGRITVRVDPGAARGFFARRHFWVDYGDVDLSSVDPAVALLPALGTVIPVALALGVPVEAPIVDAAFGARIDGIVDTVRRMYPHFAQTGFVLSGPRTAQSAMFEPSGKAALLYSGGVDSVTSLIRHRDEVECLVSVWGADVELENSELWSRLKSIVDAAPARPSARSVVARTNMRQVSDELQLNRCFDHGFARSNWWGGVHHGPGLITLAAPLAAAFGISKVIIASTYSTDFSEPWGSGPELEGQIQWIDGQACHDGFELHRQQKITEVIAPWIAHGNDLKLAVCCRINRRGYNVNCGTCEKCMRTISGLLAAGVDPAALGIPVNDGSVAAWRERMTARQVKFGDAEIFMWRAIQRGIDRPHIDLYGAPAYLAWLKQFDVIPLAEDSTCPGGKVGNMPAWRYAGGRIARRLPYGIRRVLRK